MAVVATFYQFLVDSSNGIVGISSATGDGGKLMHELKSRLLILLQGYPD